MSPTPASDARDDLLKTVRGLEDSNQTLRAMLRVRARRDVLLRNTAQDSHVPAPSGSLVAQQV